MYIYSTSIVKSRGDCRSWLDRIGNVVATRNTRVMLRDRAVFHVIATRPSASWKDTHVTRKTASRV